MQRRRIGVDHVVGEDDGEGLVADEVCGHQHGVAEAERLALPHVRDVDHVRDLADLLEQFELAALLEEAFELDVDVEMILDRVLAAAGDDDDVLDAGRDASSTPYWMIGLSTSGSISFGCALVAGRNRVPRPAAGKTTLRTDDFTRVILLGGQSYAVGARTVAYNFTMLDPLTCAITRKTSARAAEPRPGRRGRCSSSSRRSKRDAAG